MEEREEKEKIENIKDLSETPEIHAEEGPKKALWIGLVIAFFFMIFIILFVLSTQYSSKKVSVTELGEGKKIELLENKSLIFKFNKEKHEMLIENVESNSADLIIQSDPIKMHIVLGKTYFVDLDKDLENDLKIMLDSVIGNRAVISIKRIDGDYCMENWKCTEWSDCINRQRKRKCNDLNECGNNKTKPNEEVFCMGEIGEEENETFQENWSSSQNLSDFIGNGELTCAQNNAAICRDSERCDGYFINSSDSARCCFGNCTLILLNDSVSYIQCNKDISLFKEASNNCSNFSMDCSEKIIFSGLGIVREFNSSFELKGYSNGSCILYYKYNNFSISYTEDKTDEFLDSGKSMEEINFELNSLNEGYNSMYAGNSIICYYPQNDLKSFLYKWETGKETWSIDLLGNKECTGDLQLN